MNYELTGKPICTRCLKPVKKKEEYLKYDHQHKKCFKKPNWLEKKRCSNCRHIPHKDTCNEGMAHSGPPLFEIMQICGCTEIQK